MDRDLFRGLSLHAVWSDQRIFQASGVYFIDPEMKWVRHYDPEHGTAASLLPDISPRGGGFQPDGKTRNPAWDWRVYIEEGVEAGQEVTFPMRAIYKRFVSDEDIMAEYRKWTLER